MIEWGLTLADLRRQFPGWDVWRAADQMCYGRPKDRPEIAALRGEDATDLRDQMRGWIGRNTDEDVSLARTHPTGE